MKYLRRTLADWMYIFFQVLSVPYEFFLFTWFRVRVYRPEEFSLPSGSLLVANHQSKLDPFFITYGVGVKNWISILPTRYPVISEYMKIPVLGFLISLIGGYDVGATPIIRMKKLLYTRDILLHHKNTLLIFPEGKINRTIDVDYEGFQDGIKKLLVEDVPVVFVRLTGLNRKSFSRPFDNVERSICYSKVFRYESIEEKLRQMSEFYK